MKPHMPWLPRPKAQRAQDRSGRKNGRTVFPGITKFADQAGVTRIHAYRVLTGERRSPRLTSLWESFQSQTGKKILPHQ